MRRIFPRFCKTESERLENLSAFASVKTRLCISYFSHKRKIILPICNDKTPFRLSNRLHKIVCVDKRAVYVDVLSDFLDARDAHIFAEH